MTLTASHGSLAAVFGLSLGDPGQSAARRERHATPAPRRDAATVIDVTPLVNEQAEAGPQASQRTALAPAAATPLTYARPARAAAPALRYAAAAAPGSRVDLYA